MQEHNTEGKDAKYAISTARDPDPKKVIVISCSEKDAEEIAKILKGKILHKI